MTATVAIIDYGSGNLRSAVRAFERVVRELDLDTGVLVTGDPEQVLAADHIVLPGVGAYGDCAAGLRGRPGMVDALQTAVIEKGRPFLGVCVGMQLMARVGREFGDHAGLGWIDGEVAAFSPTDPALKIPHMGWNELVSVVAAHPVLSGLEDGAHVYFVHSFQFRAAHGEQVLAQTVYGDSLTAIMGRDNMVGTQFHPEKSQKAGLRLIGNFLRWKP